MGLCYGYSALEHILTTPVDSSGTITQFYVLSLPLNILKRQYRTGPVAQRAIEAAAATHDLAANPRVVVQIIPELREVSATSLDRVRSDTASPMESWFNGSSWLSR